MLTTILIYFIVVIFVTLVLASSTGSRILTYHHVSKLLFFIIPTVLIALLLLYTAYHTTSLSLDSYWSMSLTSSRKSDSFFYIGDSLFFKVIDYTAYWPFLFVFFLVTPLTLVYTFLYNSQELRTFLNYIVVIFISGFILFQTNSLIFFFIAYEMLLIPSFVLLYFFAKTRKSVEAAFLMFFWTQFGALFLIFNLQYFFFVENTLLFSDLEFLVLSKPESVFLFTTLLLGFGVKFPIWPFYDWLPKAHVEASTNFSIFLSGVLVKFAFFGFFKYLMNLGIDIVPLWVYPFVLVGFIDSSLKVYYQIDLKKLIAYSTVIEMHWLLISVVSGNGFFWIAGFAMMISHAAISSNFFLIIDSVTRRFKTRLISEISGLYFFNPNLYFVTLLTLITFLGFPGSLLFIAEMLFFSSLLDINFVLFFFVLFIAYFVVPSCFFKSWFLLLFGYNNLTDSTATSGFFKTQTSNVTLDLSTSESVITYFFIVLVFWLGFSFQFFF